MVGGRIRLVRDYAVLALKMIFLLKEIMRSHLSLVNIKIYILI